MLKGPIVGCCIPSESFCWTAEAPCTGVDIFEFDINDDVYIYGKVKLKRPLQ